MFSLTSVVERLKIGPIVDKSGLVTGISDEVSVDYRYYWWSIFSNVWLFFVFKGPVKKPLHSSELVR